MNRMLYNARFRVLHCPRSSHLPALLRPVQLPGPSAVGQFAPGVRSGFTCRASWHDSTSFQSGGSRDRPRGAAGGRGPGGGSRDSSSGGRGPGNGDRDRDDLNLYRDLPSFLQLVERGAAVWDLYTFFHAFNRAGKFAERPGVSKEQLTATMAALAEAYLPRVAALWRPKDCVMPLWACAKAGYWEGGLAAALLARLGKGQGALLRKANAQDHSNLWWAVSEAPAAFKREARAALDTSAGCLLQMTAVSIGSAQACSNVLLACARLQYGSSPDLLHHLTTCLGDPKLDPKPQELANALYALGELYEDCGHTPRPQDLQRLVERVVAELQRNPTGFAPQGLSNISLACAKLQIFSSQKTAMTLLASESLRRRFEGFVPQDLNNVMYGLALMGYADQTWWKEAVQVTKGNASVLMSRLLHWANLWYYLALVRHCPMGLLGCMDSTPSGSGQLSALVNSGEQQACWYMLWALQVLATDDGGLSDSLASRLASLPCEEMPPRALSSTLWALAAMPEGALSRHRGLAEGLVREAVRLGPGAFSQEQLAQLWQAWVEVEAAMEQDASSWLCEPLSDDVATALRSALQQAAREGAALTPGAAQPGSDRQMGAEVAAALSDLQQRQQAAGDVHGPGILSVLPEQVVEGLCGRVDVLVELAGGRRVAVEVDGPTRFLANEPHTRTPTGATQLRHRQLRRALGSGGVVSVPYWEWEEARRGGAEGQQRYLCGLLGLQPAVGEGQPRAPVPLAHQPQPAAATKGTTWAPETPQAAGRGLLARPQRPQPQQRP